MPYCLEGLCECQKWQMSARQCNHMCIAPCEYVIILLSAVIFVDYGAELVTRYC